MIVETPQWSAPKHVKALTTTRSGGVSSRAYATLNLGDHVDDNVSDVIENRQRLLNDLKLPSEPVWLSQTHSTVIHDLGVSSLNLNSPLVGDGAMTSVARIVCAVLTADCVPLFLCDQLGTKVAVIHAGWRGMADGIIEAAVAAFNVMPEDILAWAGPCIGAENFEIGQAVRDALGGSDKAYQASPNPNKLLADLYRLAGERLAALGVKNYGHSLACTFRDSEQFFSYRRDGQSGRMASLIWLDSPTSVSP